MYAQPNKKNVTYIDDLPDLEDLESRGGMARPSGDMHGMGVGNHTPFQHSGPPGGMPEKYKKFIRTSMGEPPLESGMNPGHDQQQEFFEPPSQQHQVPVRSVNSSPTCIDVHDHVQSCPICSRFFKNDNTVYIIAIVILSIVCILLLKRVLDL